MWIALALIAAAQAAQPAQPAVEAPRPKLLAVLRLRNKLPKPAAADTDFLTDALRAAALKAAPGVRVMTRENVEVLLAQSGKKLEECEGSCEVETARLLGADYVATGELLRFGARLRVSLRLHETREGALLAGAQAKGGTLDELEADLQKVAPEL